MLLLPDLAVTDVASMVSQLDLKAGTRRSGVTSAVYRFTGGQPVAVCVLLEAIAATGVTSLRRLLDGRGAAIRPGQAADAGGSPVHRLLPACPQRPSMTW